MVEALAAGGWPILPRRLSYPELLPEDLHARHLYNTDAQLARKLRDAIKNIDALRRMDLRGAVARFDWSERVAEYDDAIEAVRD